MVQIQDVTTTLLTGPSTNDPFFRKSRELRSAAFVEIHTNCGQVGLGEAYAGYFFPEVIPEIVGFFKPILVGNDVDDIPSLWRRMYHCGNYWCRVGLGASVLTALEAALWDLKGKLVGKPVYELLGGKKHSRLPSYATGGPSNYPREELARKVEHYLSLGFKGLKVGAGSYSPAGWCVSKDPAEASDFEAAKFSFLRSLVGPDVKLMLDGHMGNSPGSTWDLATAQAVAHALEPLNLFFLEEPLPYEDHEAYSELSAAATVPIAGGECLTTLPEWRPFVEKNCFDIGQPDASFLGGLEEFLRVSRLFEQRGRTVATHSWGAAGSLMQNVHCAFASQNTCILEIPPDFGGLHSDLLGDSFQMKDGWVLPPETPGLGVVLNEDIKSRYPFVAGSGEFNSVPGKLLET